MNMGEEEGQLRIAGALIENKFWRQYQNPIVINWLDTGEIEIIPAAHLNDISYCNGGREYENQGHAEDWFVYLGEPEETI